MTYSEAFFCLLLCFDLFTVMVAMVDTPSGYKLVVSCALRMYGIYCTEAPCIEGASPISCRPAAYYKTRTGLTDSPLLIRFHCSLIHVAVLRLVWSSYSNSLSLYRVAIVAWLVVCNRNTCAYICMAIHACSDRHTARFHLSIITSCSTPALFLVPPSRQMHHQSVTINRLSTTCTLITWFTNNFITSVIIIIILWNTPPKVQTTVSTYSYLSHK